MSAAIPFPSRRASALVPSAARTEILVALRVALVGMLAAAAPLGAQRPAAATYASASLAATQERSGGGGTLVVTAARAERGIDLDGRLTETAWTDAQPVTEFSQQRPEPGAPASERTDVRVLYDAAAIYVGMRLYDAAPDSLVAPLGRRDYAGHSDWAQVIVDSYHDRRTAFRFAVNPSGVKRDALVSGDAEWNEDPSWDAVWEVATTRDSAGWTAEFRIPLTQLRFSSTTARAEEDERLWGIQFSRDIARRNERVYWAPISPEAAGYVSLFGTLTGLRGLSAPRRLEVVPYTSARATLAPVDHADPFSRGAAFAGEAGADVRYGLTSDLTLTATINPDFGQVEADPSEVNLTGMESFFAERRPFFVEGADIFDFRASSTDWVFGQEQLFYSRRIGRSPQGAVPDEAEYEDAPDAARLLGAVKLSGKTASGWSVGVLNAITAPEHAEYAAPGGERGRIVVEPLTSYSVARAVRDYASGRNAVGAIVTAANRRLAGDAVDHLHSAAYTAGFDWRYRLDSGGYQVSGSLMGSRVNGTPEAIARTQEASNHYLQRPDAPHLRYDPTRTSLSGGAADIQLWKMSGRWRWGFVGHAVTSGFEANDLGFGARSDYGSTTGWIGYNHFQPGRVFRRWSAFVNAWSQWSLGGERLVTGFDVWAGGRLRNDWEINVRPRRDLPGLSTSELRGGPALYTPGRTSLRVRVASDARRAVQAELLGGAHAEDGTGGRLLSLTPTVNVRALGRLEMSLGPSLTWRTHPWQYVDYAREGDRTTYITGHLEQTTVALTTRLNYSFTPNLSLQLYAQPFLSAGQYGAFREVRDPKSSSIDGRFRTIDGSELARRGDAFEVDRDGNGVADFSFDDPGYNFRELLSNAVLRWEYRPGSTLFLVWSQGRESDRADGGFDLDRDTRRLFDSAGTNVLLVKLSYWLTP